MGFIFLKKSGFHKGIFSIAERLKTVHLKKISGKYRAI